MVAMRAAVRRLPRLVCGCTPPRRARTARTFPSPSRRRSDDPRRAGGTARCGTTCGLRRSSPRSATAKGEWHAPWRAADAKCVPLSTSLTCGRLRRDGYTRRRADEEVDRTACRSASSTIAGEHVTFEASNCSEPLKKMHTPRHPAPQSVRGGRLHHRVCRPVRYRGGGPSRAGVAEPNVFEAFGVVMFTYAFIVRCRRGPRRPAVSSRTPELRAHVLAAAARLRPLGAWAFDLVASACTNPRTPEHPADLRPPRHAGDHALLVVPLHADDARPRHPRPRDRGCATTFSRPGCARGSAPPSGA